MASLARTASFTDLPFVGSAPGWIQTQSFTQFGSRAWDSATHYPFNNTPQGVLSSMLINDSTYCPAAAMSSEHGCITFNASGEGSDWPFFLELVSDPNGAGITPCGWFGAQGAGVPGFSTTAAHGDGPCLLPGRRHDHEQHCMVDLPVHDSPDRVGCVPGECAEFAERVHRRAVQRCGIGPVLPREPDPGYRLRAADEPWLRPTELRRRPMVPAGTDDLRHAS